MKTTTQEKKTGLRNLGFTEIINLIVIKGGNDNPPAEKSDVTTKEQKNGEEQPV